MSKSAKEGAELLTTEKTVQVKFVFSGERERLKKLAREKLEQAGWTDDLRQQCREFASHCGADALTHEALVSEVRQQGRAQVPDHIKAELLKEIRTVLES